MDKYWVIGHPLTFCLTTPVMNGAFEDLDIAAHFETKDVAPEDHSKVIEDLKRGALKGLVVTRPHKTPSVEDVDVKSEEVEMINAVNLILRKDGQLHGYNTDWIGASECIKKAIDSLEGKEVLVLGAGGAARAAAYACKKEGADVYIWNRTGERAQEFAEKLGVNWVEDMRMWNGSPQIIINATAASDQPKQSSLVPFTLWQNVELALDAVYGKTSLFLEEAKGAQVAHVLSGEEWFMHHFTPLFRHITGQEPPFELVKKLTLESQRIKE